MDESVSGALKLAVFPDTSYHAVKRWNRPQSPHRHYHAHRQCTGKPTGNIHDVWSASIHKVARFQKSHSHLSHILCLFLAWFISRRLVALLLFVLCDHRFARFDRYKLSNTQVNEQANKLKLDSFVMEYWSGLKGCWLWLTDLSTYEQVRNRYKPCLFVNVYDYYPTTYWRVHDHDEGFLHRAISWKERWTRGWTWNEVTVIWIIPDGPLDTPIPSHPFFFPSIERPPSSISHSSTCIQDIPNRNPAWYLFRSR